MYASSSANGRRGDEVRIRAASAGVSVENVFPVFASCIDVDTVIKGDGRAVVDEARIHARTERGECEGGRDGESSGFRVTASVSVDEHGAYSIAASRRSVAWRNSRKDGHVLRQFEGFGCSDRLGVAPGGARRSPADSLANTNRRRLD